MSEGDAEAERLTLAGLKRVATTTPQTFAVHVQVDSTLQKPTQQGKLYLELRLQDGEENMVWRVFDAAPWMQAAADLRKGDWIALVADWVDTGRFGIEPRNVAVRRLTESEVEAMLAGDEGTRRRQREDYDFISTSLHSMSDPRLRGISLLFLQVHGDRFRRAAAARDFHHARRGGLVEHVAQMMRCALKIADAYPLLNRDLLTAGVLFHDCGKLWENNYAEGSFSMPFTLHGELLGHIPMGLEIVNKLWRQLLDSPEAVDWVTLEPPGEHVRLHLLHLVGAHHGTYEFGSPVLPKTPEAIVLHHVDNIDAKLEMFRRAYQNGAEIGPGIFERVRPLPSNVVRQLPDFRPEASPSLGPEDRTAQEDLSDG